MSSGIQALLLIGSPRGKMSTSYSLGSFLLEILKEKGWETQNQHIQKSLKTQDGKNKLLSQMDCSDIIILTFPLYVDTLPAPVIEMMELIRKHYELKEKSNKQRLVTIVNSGFPEPDHSNIAITNCKIFCRETGIDWAGGLTIGGGEAIAGRPLKEVKGMARKIIKALDFTAKALSSEKPIPNKALELTSKPLVPKWLYLFAGTRMWKSKAKKNGAIKKIYDSPYTKT